MKCSACYADNAGWATVCLMCGQPVVPIEICPNGHLLPPGSRECAICPSTWPETPAFSGPPILRGVLVVDRGELVPARGASRADFLELRDGEAPLTLVQASPDRVEKIASDGPAGDARILVRPDGVRVCLKSGVGRKGGLGYDVVPPGESITMGGVTLRAVFFDVPGGVGR